MIKLINYIGYLALLCLVGCILQQDFTKVKFRTIYGNTPIKINMIIPKGYKEKVLLMGNDLEKQYWYSDSSVIYITASDLPLINYHRIRATGRSGDRLHFYDTLTLYGIDKQGIYWKDIKIKPVGSIGYVSVGKEKVEKFEKALKSIERK